MPLASKQARRTKIVGKGYENIYKSRSGRYEIAYRSNSKLQWFSCPLGWTLTEAKTKRAELTVAKNDGTLSPPSKLTLSQAVAKWLADGKPTWAPRTYDSRESTMRLHVVPVLGSVRVRDLTKHHVGRLVTEMQKSGLGTSSQKLAVSMFAALCSFLIDEDQLSVSPVATFSRSRRAKRQLRSDTATAKVKVKIIGNVPALLAQTTKPYVLLFKVAILSGLRLGEVLGLRVQDVQEGVLLVRGQLDRDTRAWTPRTKTPESKRDVIVPTALTTELLASVPEDAKPDALLFVAKDGKGYWAQVIERAFERAVKAAKLDESLTFHTTRHTAASRWIYEGRTASFVQGQLGHKSLSTTIDTYTHEFNKAKEGDAAREAADAAYDEITAKPTLRVVA